jgi:hypothetical protein
MPEEPDHANVRAVVQLKSNINGYDYGLESNGRGRTYARILPVESRRSGNELTCEVVSCADPARRKPGHGGKPEVAAPRRDGGR